MTEFNITDNRLPVMFKGFFQANWDFEKPCVLNDAMHLVVKIIWRLVRKNMMIGNCHASRSIIHDTLLTNGKANTGVDPSVVTDIKDAMNYDRAEKLCSSGVYNLMNSEQELGTKLFLKMATCVNDAFVKSSSSPEERLHKSYYALFFCRLWRKHTVTTRGRTLKDDFLSSNAYTCLEINVHNLLKFLVLTREMGKPELFLPFLANSQVCEELFRHFRSMSSTDYTTINFDILELLHRVRRTEKIEEIKNKIDISVHNFETGSLKKRKKEKDDFVPTTLPSNETIKSLVDRALQEVLHDLDPLGINCDELLQQDFSDPQVYPKYNVPTAVTDLDTENFAEEEEADLEADEENMNQTQYDSLAETQQDVGSSRRTSKRVKVPTAKAKDLAEELFAGDGLNDGQGDDEETNVLVEMRCEDIFLSNILTSELIEDTSEGPPVPTSFVKIKGRVKHVRKSFVLWTLSRRHERVSQDRLRRFISQKKKLIKKNDFIFLSGFAKIFIPSRKCEEYVQVLGFRKVSGTKVDITKPYMPLITKGVGAIVDLYLLETESDGVVRLKYSESLKEPVIFKNFVRHVENDELQEILN